MRRVGIKQYLASNLLGPARFERVRWEKAQRGEFEWWRKIATTGFDGRTTNEFLSVSQRDGLLAQLTFMERRPDSWKNGTVVEFGSDPAGFVEYIEAERKIAIEPLTDRYRMVFPHLAASTVEYCNRPAEDVGNLFDGIADLVICFNALDHTRDPNRVIEHLARVVKTGADLLFQVNVYLSQDEVQQKSPKHAQLHPHSLRPETVVSMLQAHQFAIWKEQLSAEVDHNGEHFFICAGVKT